MSRKRNEFLDASDEEEGSLGFSDAEIEGSRFSKVGRSATKRRKLSSPEEDESEGSASEHSIDSTRHPEDIAPKDPMLGPSTTSISGKESSIPTHAPAPATEASSKPKIKALTPRQLAESQRKARKTGVIYLSRIPPYMKPTTVRQLLSPYGDLLRVFLSPETAVQHAKRVKAGGNRKKSFTEGWVEFVSKKKARICADSLNGRMIGGKKGGFYHDDIWNMKYLKKFKWDDLMQQVQEEAREREGKLRAALQQERRERRYFLQNVESAKQVRGMEAKRAAKKKETGGGREAEAKSEVEAEKTEQRLRKETTYEQHKLKERDMSESSGQPEEVRKIMRQIF